jgi:glutathione S-transferase
MRKLYGGANSRALRSLWMLEELGLEYEHVPIDFAKRETKGPAYLAINPNGRIPALVDGELVLWESMAINLYLARTYDGGLWPTASADRARALQWSFWVMTETEAPLVEAIANRFLLPADQRKPERIGRAERALAAPLAVLDGALAGRPALVGERFGVADLNVASVLAWMRLVGFATDATPHVGRWLDACLARPAFARARAR